MIEDEVVKKYGLTPAGFGGTAKDAAVIFKLAGQFRPQVASLCDRYFTRALLLHSFKHSLANNNLRGKLLNQLCKYLPQHRKLVT